MSFLRGEAVSLVIRGAEPLLAGLAALWLGASALRLGLGGQIAAILPAAGAALAALWCGVSGTRLAIALRRGSEDLPGPGVVLVEEGRISYFGPIGVPIGGPIGTATSGQSQGGDITGGIIRLDDLLSIDLLPATRKDRARIWRFCDLTGAELQIPETAEGAENLPDALGHVPGLSYQTMATALLSRSSQVQPVWRRPATARLR
ncbi:MAG: hypothetical protein AAGE13_15655 [Pseudomonadota bacterium]